MQTLYIANKNYSSWSLRPWVLMKELGIPFEERLIPFKDEANWSAYRAICPSGKVPCLIDDAVTVWDSVAITEYLAEHHEGVWPTDAVARAWARCAVAEMHSGFPTLREICSMNIGLRIRLKATNPALRKDIDRIDALWSDGLRRFGGPFLAGDTFTAVDAFYTPVAFRVQTHGLPMSREAESYVLRLLSLASMTQWQSEALKEAWRDPDHEQEALESGDVLADHRASVPPG